MILVSVSKAFARIAGVPAEATELAPELVGTPATFGLMLLGATVLSATSMGYAAYRIAFGSSLAVLDGILAAILFWPLIFAIDRSFLIVRISGSKWAVAVKVLVRLVVAVLFGWALSIPLFLAVEENVLQLALYQDTRAEIAREAGENAHLSGRADYQSAAEKATEEVREAERVLAAGPSASPAYKAAVSKSERAEMESRSVEARVLPAIGVARAQLQASPAGAPESNAVSARLHALQLELNEARSDLARAEADVTREENVWRTMSEQRLKQANLDAAAANNQFHRVDQQTRIANAQSEEKISRLSTATLAMEWATAERVMNDRSNPQSAPMRGAAWLFHAMGVLLEMLVVLTKMMSPASGMDAVVASIEAESLERRIRIANARMARIEMTETASTEVCAAWVEAWKAEQMGRIHLGLTSQEFKVLRDEAENLMQNA